VFDALCRGEVGIRDAVPGVGPVARTNGTATGTGLARAAVDEAIAGVDPEGLALVGASTAGDMVLGELAFEQQLRGEQIARPADFLWTWLCHRPTRVLAAEIGATGRVSAARRAGRAAGLNLRSARVNVDLAPVADVARPGSAMEREGRSYGRRPGKVARFAAAFARGLQGTGVLATGKHFPGFGAARANTDLARVTIETPLGRLRRVDLRPYRTLFRHGVRLVMLSTAIYTALDPGTPAAFSRRIARGELRRRLGFTGVSMTDALGTPATAPYGSADQVGVRAARAGVDLMLYSSYAAGKRAARTLARAIRRGRLPRTRAEQSVRRILEVRRKLP